jgi:hypothetical protein
MKDQESLSYVALKNGWKLESDNQLIQKINKENKNPTISEYLEENKEKFDIYNS